VSGAAEWSSAGLDLVLVLARADNGVIGHQGRLPWRIKSDMAHFKRLTMGKPLIMGRKTWDTLGGPLRGRDNIVVSRTAGFVARGGYAAGSLGDALALAAVFAAKNGAKEVCVIGGGEIYSAALPLADRIELTEIHMDAEGDTIIDPFSTTDWAEVRRDRHQPAQGESAAYSFVTLVPRAEKIPAARSGAANPTQG